MPWLLWAQLTLLSLLQNGKQSKSASKTFTWVNGQKWQTRLEQVTLGLGFDWEQLGQSWPCLLA